MGTTLTEEQRADFIDRSVRLYRQAETQFEKITDQYTKLAETQGVDVSQIIIDSGYTGTIPEINKDIQKNLIPPRPSPDQFPNNAEWAEFANQFASNEAWKEHWIRNMTQDDREKYIDAMSQN